MLLATFIREGIEALGGVYPPEEARSLVYLVCRELLGTHSYTAVVEPQYAVPSGKEAALKAALDRLAAGEPVQYVLGYADFAGRRFRVSPAVLIPRPETEELCRRAVELAARMQRRRAAFGSHADPVRVLDLCTGSGCIAWTLALDVPGAQVTGVDISEAALSVAMDQFPQVPRRERPAFLRADVLEPLPFAAESMDVILSNPPYVRESEKALMRRNVLDYEPALSLFVPDDDPLRFYRALAGEVKRIMTPDGVGLVEINEALGPDTERVFREAGFPFVETFRDIFEKPRFILFRKTAS